MEGVEFEIRSASQTYPLSLDQRILQADNYRTDRQTLLSNLKTIDTLCNASTDHTRFPDCSPCLTRKTRIREAYCLWYVSDEPDRWYSCLPEYKSALLALIKNPDVSLDDIHHRAETELRKHFQRDLCASTAEDSENLRRAKFETADRLMGSEPTVECLSTYFVNIIQAVERSHGPAALEFLQRLQQAKSAPDRVPIFIDYYCKPFVSDSSQLRNFKARYARQFEAGESHDRVVLAMRKEALQLQQSEIDQLSSRLGELQMARAAHQRTLVKKLEKARKKEGVERARERMEVVKCELQECGDFVDLKSLGGPIQCGLCDWIASKVGQRKPGQNKISYTSAGSYNSAPSKLSQKQGRLSGEGRTFYCCVEHAEADIVQHDQDYHQCEAGDHCINYPSPGPPEDCKERGICPDCIGHEGRASFFCSQPCYEKNLETHRSHRHDPNAMSDTSATLTFFSPLSDLKVENIS